MNPSENRNATLAYRGQNAWGRFRPASRLRGLARADIESNRCICAGYISIYSLNSKENGAIPMKFIAVLIFVLSLGVFVTVPSGTSLAATPASLGCQARYLREAAREVRDQSGTAHQPNGPVIGTGKGPVGLYVIGGHGPYCRGLGICFIKGHRDRGPHCWSCTEGEITRGDDGTVLLEFPATRARGGDDRFVIDEDLPIPIDVARRLGARGDLAVMRGVYRARWVRKGRIVSVGLRIRGEWAGGYRGGNRDDAPQRPN